MDQQNPGPKRPQSSEDTTLDSGNRDKTWSPELEDPEQITNRQADDVDSEGDEEFEDAADDETNPTPA
jgi:hypothetical protein